MTPTISTELKQSIREYMQKWPGVQPGYISNEFKISIPETFELLEEIKEHSQTQASEIPEQLNAATEIQEIVPEWETPAHTEIDPFDPEYDLIVNAQISAVEPGVVPFVRAAIKRGFHVFPLIPRDKHPLPGSQGFKDSKSPDDSNVLVPWNEDPNRNIGINLGASDLCVLDFDKPESIPAWLSETKTYKVRTGKGVHIYFRGARKTTKLYVDGQIVGDLKSTGGYVLGENSVHPSGAIYTAIDDSSIVDAPDRISELVKHETERVNASEDGPPIPHGKHDDELFRIGCGLRNMGMNYSEIREALIGICERRCENYGSDYVDMCEKKAKSACKYPVGQASPSLQFEAQTVQPETTGRKMQFIRGDSIKPARLKWLWRGRILADKLNVFSGEPDVGKGMTTVDLAARITRHWDFPDCKNELNGPKDVVFLSSEDDMEDTIVPRLIVAGADMSRIHFVQISENTSGTVEEGIVRLDEDLPALEEMVKQHPDTVLIIPDPVIAFLGNADPNKDRDVRPIYSKMKNFAKKLNVGWLFVNHWNKNQNATSINRTSGAKTMVSAPRATWMFTKSPEDPTRFLMMKGKGNLSSNSVKTLAYRIKGQDYDFQDGRGIEKEAIGKLIWDGETDHTTEEVLQDANEPKLRRNTKAEEFLTRFLQDGAKLASEVYTAGDKESFRTDKLKRARYALDYVAEEIGRRWYWAKSQEDLAGFKTRVYSKGTHVSFEREKPEESETVQDKQHGGVRPRAGRKSEIKL